MTPNQRQQVESWLDTAIKISIPVMVATLVGVAGLLRSHDNRLVGLERDTSHITSMCESHRNGPHPPEWVADTIKEIREDIKAIRRDVAEIGKRQIRTKEASAANVPDSVGGSG